MIIRIHSVKEDNFDNPEIPQLNTVQSFNYSCLNHLQFENEMLVRIQSLLLIYAVFVLSYLYKENYAENNTNEFVGAVRNLSVKFLQDLNYKEKQDAYKSLKLNISWLPPNSSKQPSSYR